MFTSISPSKIEEVLNEVPSLVTDRMNEALISLATEEEVRQALFMMHLETASGPYGITALFFQRAWHTIKKDLLELINGFLRTCFLTKC